MPLFSWRDRWHGPGGGRELLALAWPLILSNSIWTLQIALDRILLGQNASADLAASLPAVMLFWTLISLFQHTANYATTFVAQYLGAGRPHRVGPAIGQSLYFSVFGGLVFIGLAPFAEGLMALGGHAAELQAREAAFLRCLCFAALPTLLTETEIVSVPPSSTRGSDGATWMERRETLDATNVCATLSSWLVGSVTGAALKRCAVARTEKRVPSVSGARTVKGTRHTSPGPPHAAAGRERSPCSRSAFCSS